MSTINKNIFLGRWIHVPDEQNDSAFFKFVQMSGLTTATPGTRLDIKFTEEDGVWSQHDNFVGVNNLTYAFTPGVQNVITMENGTLLTSTVTILGNTWNWDTDKGGDKYATQYDFHENGDTMTMKSVYMGKDGSSFSAFAIVKRENV